MSELKYLNPEEVARLLGYLRRLEDRLWYLLLWVTGARVSEVLALRPIDIDYDAKRLDLPALKRKDKERKFVAIYDPNLLQELRGFTKNKAKDKPIFSISRQVVYMRLAMAGHRAGFDGRIHPHLLRHSMAVNWTKKGGDLLLLSRQLGHASYLTTANLYQHYQTSDILKEAERIFSK